MMPMSMFRENADSIRADQSTHDPQQPDHGGKHGEAEASAQCPHPRARARHETRPGRHQRDRDEGRGEANTDGTEDGDDRRGVHLQRRDARRETAEKANGSMRSGPTGEPSRATHDR